MTLFTRFVLILSIFTIFSCGDSTNNNKNTLTLGIESKPKSLDPRYATDANGMRISHHLIFSTLVQLGYDLKIVPELAKSWEIKDNKTYIFHLRDNVFFHNGDKLLASDVRFTFEHLMDPKTKSPFAGTYKGIIDEIIVIDDYTVKFVLKKPVASFLTSIIMPVLPEKVVKKGGFAKELIGSGPFKLIKKLPTEISLTSFDKYYDGKPEFENLKVKVIKDDNTRFLKMKKGELDVVVNALPMNRVNKFKEGDLAKRYNVVESPGVTYQYLAFNMNHPSVSNPDIRKAIAYGIDVKEIIKYRLDGHAILSKSLISPVNFFHDKSSKMYNYNPPKAIEHLNKAGFSPDKKLKLELKTSNNAQVVGIARIIQAQLAKIGIELKITSYEWGTFYGDIKSGNFQFTSMRWVGVTEPDFYYDLFHSNQLPPKGRNRGRYVNKEIDKLVEKGRITLSTPDRKLIYGKVQKILSNDLPYISLWHMNNVSIVHKRVSGYKSHPTGAYLSLKNIVLRKDL
ncbi:MAG: ABC transporter substrate-binding protein [Desulfobacterales bacterium]|nr:ABC transporter substrate-binding protein [Desulfobacterales bacterium]